MAHTLSTRKRIRQDIKRHLRNQSVKTRIKGLTKKFRAATEGSDTAETARTLKETIRALDKAARHLALASSSVADDLRLAKKTERTLDRRFKGDATFNPLLTSAIDLLEAGAVQLRDGLAAWESEVTAPKDARRLAKAVKRFDRLLAKAHATGDQGKRAGRLRNGCTEIERAAVRIGVDPTDPPVAGRAPSFLLADVNTTSPTYDADVSPRDFLGGVSAWYFGHST